jgi:hypothetical protein
LPREIWAKIVLKQTTLEKAIADGEAEVGGDPKALGAVFGSFG